MKRKSLRKRTNPPRTPKRSIDQLSASCGNTQKAYIPGAGAVFVELTTFARHRPSYMDDPSFRKLQARLMLLPESGDVIEGTGGLRKLRFGDPRRGKGTRGGLRVIYYWWNAGSQFWLLTLFDKGEMSDLTATQRAELKAMLRNELRWRNPA